MLPLRPRGTSDGDKLRELPIEQSQEGTSTMEQPKGERPP